MNHADQSTEANSSAEFTAQEEGRHCRSQPDVSEISGRSLAITILLIMVTAFGAGHFLARPLLPQNR